MNIFIKNELISIVCVFQIRQKETRTVNRDKEWNSCIFSIILNLMWYLYDYSVSFYSSRPLNNPYFILTWFLLHLFSIFWWQYWYWWQYFSDHHYINSISVFLISHSHVWYRYHSNHNWSYCIFLPCIVSICYPRYPDLQTNETYPSYQIVPPSSVASDLPLILTKNPLLYLYPHYLYLWYHKNAQLTTTVQHAS